jgi:hypothetical protein
MTTPERRYVSISEIREFRSCQKRWQYLYRDRQRPVSSGAARQVGKFVHRALEEFWKGKSIAETRMMLKPAQEHSFFKTPKGQIQLARSHATITAYFSYWESERDKWEIIEQDAGVERWVRGKLDHLGLNAKILGRVDVLARYKETGVLHFIDSKTTSDDISTTGADFWQRLAMDIQATAYQELLQVEFQEPVKILFDAIHKIQNSPKLKTGAPKKKKSETDEEFQERKRVHEEEQRETPVEFSNRMAQEILANPTKWFQRRIIPRLQDDIDIYREERDTTICDMLDPERTVFPRNDSACKSRFGPCHFLGVCTGIEAIDCGKFEHVPVSVPGFVEEPKKGRAKKRKEKGVTQDDFDDVPEF